jgi:hypothetical protein
MKHEKMEMVQERLNRKISIPTAHFRGGKGIWLRKMICPECGAVKNPPANLGHDRKYFCKGQKSNDD